MLKNLYITNYALIDETNISFHPGLNIITGETGAGKSIILGALSMLLGGRADIKKANTEGKKTIVEAEFKIDNYPELKLFFEENDIDNPDNSTCILRREIASNGRTRSFINDTPVTLNILQELTAHLTDIHSQHQNQLLSKSEFQLKVIDTLAENEQFLSEYQVKFVGFKNALRKLKKTKAIIEKNRNNEDFLKYQLEQLESADLKSGELEELKKQQEVLSNISNLKNSLYKTLEYLSEGRANAINLVESAQESLDNISDEINQDDDLLGRLENIKVDLKDVSSNIYSLYDNLSSSDPSYLESIEERIAELHGLLNKYNAASVEELIETEESIRNKLDSLATAEDTLLNLEKNAKRAFSIAKEAANLLSEKRKGAAKLFESILLKKAIPLGMKNLRCEVKIEPTDISMSGADKVTFTFAFNKNQTPTTVGGNASGGEISRLMLCIKSMIADKMSLPTIIFDEIDTGVSGEIALKIGEMMKEISKSIQVIAITHLPQVAALGDHHFKVYKMDDDLSTHTRIKHLKETERIDELALMLGGGTDPKAAKANAISLLNKN